MPKQITKRQNAFLHSTGSPLTSAQKDKLNGEIRNGTVKFSARKKRRRARRK